MTAPALFEHPDFGCVRVVMVDDDPWFIAGDVCALLDLGNVGQALAGLDDDEKSSITIADGTPGNPNKSVVSEAGLWSLILRSRKPEAKAVKRWVTHEVLPAIRATGSYSVAAAPVELPGPRELALMVIAAEDRADEAEKRAAQAAADREALEAPAAAWDHLANSNGDVSVADAAKILSRDPAIKIGRDRLFTVLAGLGWTFRGRADGRWRVMQTAIETRRLCEAPSSHYHPRTGELVIDPPQVRITFKGLSQLHRRLGGAAPLALDQQLGLEAS